MTNMSIPPLVYVQLKSALIQIKEETHSRKKLAWATGLLNQLDELEVIGLDKPIEPRLSTRAMPKWGSEHASIWFNGFTWIEAFTNEELHRITEVIPDFGDRETFTAREAYELIYAIRRGLCHEEPRSIESTAHFDEVESPRRQPPGSLSQRQAGASPQAAGPRGGSNHDKDR